MSTELEVVELVNKAADRIEAVENGQSELKSAIAGVNAAIIEIAQKGTSGGLMMPGKKSPIATMFASEAVASFRNRETRNKVSYTFKSGLDLITKSTLVGTDPTSDQTGFNVQPQRADQLANDPRRRLSLIDVLPRIRASGNTFEFNRLDSYTNMAGVQPNEGALKPETSMPTDLVQVSIMTIAHWLPVSEQVLADSPALNQQINSLLLYGVASKLEQQLIVGTGSPGQIGGLTDTGNFTAFTPSVMATNAADKIGEALAYLDSTGWAGGLIILNPDDWQIMRAERVGVTGEYLVGSWSNPAPPNVWGVPVITSPYIATGNAIVMDQTQTALLDRQDANIALGWIEDQFARNVISIRAELRAGLAVFSPSAVLYFSIEPTS